MKKIEEIVEKAVLDMFFAEYGNATYADIVDAEISGEPLKDVDIWHPFDNLSGELLVEVLDDAYDSFLQFAEEILGANEPKHAGERETEHYAHGASYARLMLGFPRYGLHGDVQDDDR